MPPTSLEHAEDWEERSPDQVASIAPVATVDERKSAPADTGQAQRSSQDAAGPNEGTQPASSKAKAKSKVKSKASPAPGQPAMRNNGSGKGNQIQGASEDKGKMDASTSQDGKPKKKHSSGKSVKGKDAKKQSPKEFSEEDRQHAEIRAAIEREKRAPRSKVKGMRGVAVREEHDTSATGLVYKNGRLVIDDSSEESDDDEWATRNMDETQKEIYYARKAAGVKKAQGQDCAVM